MQLTNPENLTHAIHDLILTGPEKFDLNRRLANRTRQVFRTQIRAQRDIDDNPYQKRTRRKISTVNQSGVKVEARNTQNNKNMLMGFSRSLKTKVDDKSFEVGLSGLVGKIAQEHNDGRSVSFTTHVKGYFNTRTSRWEGGVKVKSHYRMPKRTFIGWTPSLERELLAMVAEYYLTGVEN